MGGVYGSFLENFPELLESFSVWTKEDKTDVRTVRAVYMPNKGSGIKRRKYTSGNTTLDMSGDDDFYISHKYDSLVKEGDYVEKIGDNTIMRLTELLPYDKAAGYRIFKIERVTGTTPYKNQDLNVKEATFA